MSKLMKQKLYRGIKIPDWIMLKWDGPIGLAWRTGVDMAINTTMVEFDEQIAKGWEELYERQNRPGKKDKKSRVRRNS